MRESGGGGGGWREGGKTGRKWVRGVNFLDLPRKRLRLSREIDRALFKSKIEREVEGK